MGGGDCGRRNRWECYSLLLCKTGAQNTTHRTGEVGGGWRWEEVEL